MASQKTLIQKFTKEGKTTGSASNMFIEGNVLYSYGRHFPLLVRMPHWNNGKGFLLNADKYSVSTSRHQRLCFNHATVQIPFSALIPALQGTRNFSYSQLPSLLGKLNLIDKEEERWDSTGRYTYWKDNGIRETINKSDYEALSLDEQRGCYEDKERRPEGAVLSYENRFLLSSMDGSNYFISELPQSCETVRAALSSLLPDLLIGKKEGTDYQRQGEWFFVPTDMKRIPKATIKKGEYLRNKPPRDGRPHHRVRDYVEPMAGREFPLVRGGVRHDRRDHRTLYLGDTWHLAIESNHVMSWGANGRVD